MSLRDRDNAAVWHPYTQMQQEPFAIPIVSGSGCTLVAEDGQRYLDLVSSWWTNIHGHAHPYIAEAIAAQARRLEHVIFAGFTHEPAVNLAERLLSLLPAGQKKIFYSDNGSTAVEVALKMAIQYWKNLGKDRTKFIALDGAYHGDTFGAMSLAGQGAFSKPFSSFLFKVQQIPAPVKGAEREAVDALKTALVAGDCAGFIFEPMLQAVAGMRLLEAPALSEMLGLCRKFGVPVIADEVATGFGRTGPCFATQYLSETADIYCLSKGITGGFVPLGVTSATQEIYEAFLSPERLKMLLHGHSYTANPIVCAAANASLDLFLKPECERSRASISEQHRKFVQELVAHPKIRNPRSIGTILAFDCFDGAGNAYTSSLRDVIIRASLARGVLVRPLGNIVYLMPPYCISADELRRVYQVVREILVEI